MAGKTNRAKTANTFVRMECASCGTTNQNAFYMSKDSWHKHYGKICYCKECVKAIYSDYLEKYKEETDFNFVYDWSGPYVNSGEEIENIFIDYYDPF